MDGDKPFLKKWRSVKQTTKNAGRVFQGLNPFASVSCCRRKKNMTGRKCAKMGGRCIDRDRHWDSRCPTMEYYPIRVDWDSRFPWWDKCGIMHIKVFYHCSYYFYQTNVFNPERQNPKPQIVKGWRFANARVWRKPAARTLPALKPSNPRH